MAKHSKKHGKKHGKKRGMKRRSRRNGFGPGAGQFVAASLGAVALGTAVAVGLSYTSLSNNAQDIALAAIGLAAGVVAEFMGSPRLAVGLWVAPTTVAAVRATVRMGQAGAVQRAVDSVRGAISSATGASAQGAAPSTTAQVPAQGAQQPAGLPMGYSPYAPAGMAFFGAYGPQPQSVMIG